MAGTFMRKAVNIKKMCKTHKLLSLKKLKFLILNLKLVLTFSKTYYLF